ncbi:MAG: M23 family metallopeptidase [Labrys sp. (in: a-proteobacteria)]
MTNRISPAHQRHVRQVSVDPGDEPALTIDGRRAPDRRRVNLRWLTGAVLTGVSGATLMGAAVFTALDGEYSVATSPSILSGSLAARETRDTSTTRKSNKAVLSTPDISARQTIRISTTTKVGDTDVIKVKPFTKISATLAVSPGAFAADIPPYNPTKIFAEATPEQAEEPEPVAADDGEVSVSATSLAEVKVAPDDGLTLPIEQIRAFVQEQASFESQADSLTIPPQLLSINLGGMADAPATSLSYTVDGVDSLSALDVRIVPENVTDLGKTRAPGEADSDEKNILVQEKQTLPGILTELGAGETDIDKLVASLGDDAEVQAGQRLRILMTPATDDAARQVPARVSIFTADKHNATVALSDNGDYVTVADPTATDTADAGGEQDNDGPGLPLYYSIYETALKQKVSKETIEALLRVYAYDVDLNRRARPGDTFEVFYETDENGEPIGDVLYTALTIGGDQRRYYRFVTPDDGTVDYYDEEGRSARKFLMRKPMNGGEQRSGFGMRRHPILGYWKMHTGVDWAARVGTPVVAAGNGTVIKAGWASGYGRRVEIQHKNGYITTYSHLSGFASGMKEKRSVSMGQVIGYLGSSGLSTGPHLHYEVKINGNFVDPMRIRLPQGRELDNNLLAAFKEQRDRVDAMMANEPVARLAGDDKGA